ncbi:hypothetical protein [Abyssisolibacter fermentans]|uniref:hypothetical protein n=1 Tax=Abyssisolibacter fermentans TaxID=1766203 RepID=UPI00083393C5|nr:hypothetical protein [Abyssisolibacter fermentans]
MRAKWNSLKRSKFFFFLMVFNYILLAIVDNKSILLMSGIEQYIYRYNFQQIFIVISSAIFVNILFNERSIDSIKNYLVIYIKDIKTEIYRIVLLISITNISAFIIGQLLVLVINYIYFGEVNVCLFFVNLAIVSLEIIICIIFVIGLRLLFKKDILVFGIFYLIILILLIINNVFVTIPLTIKILGLGGQGYYITYDPELWLGRIILLSISFIILKLSLQRFGKELKN